MKIYPQSSAYDSPWTKSQRLKMLVWEYTWSLFCSWTPKPANRWRLFWLKLFGAKIYGRPFVHQRARIQIPWNLILHHRAAIGDRTTIYSLGKIEIHEGATVAQEAYLCTGTHAFNKPSQNLITAPVIIKAYAFIGARAFIMPGIIVEEHAIVGACSVVTKNVASYKVVAGNPALIISKEDISKRIS